MKTTQATVNLVLNEQRKNKAGLCPVVLRVFWKGRKDRQTGIYVAKSQWSVKEQRVKPTHPESVTLNQRLLELKDKVIQRRNALVAKGLDYTIDDLLSERELLSYGSSLVSILDGMVIDKGLSQNTVMAYKASLKRLSSVGVNSLTDVNPDAIQGICKRLKGLGLGDSTINMTLASLGSLWGYCQSKGFVEGYLFQKYKFWKQYRIQERRISVTQKDLDKLLGDFLNRSVIADAVMGQWCYTDCAERDLMNRNSVLFAQCCFLMGYYCQGLAFCDLVRIKSENISVIEVKGKEYYRIKGLKRKKTNRPIKEIVIEVTNEIMPLFEIFIRSMDSRDGFLLPVLGGYGYKDAKQISEATGSCSTVVNRGIRTAFERCGLNSEGVSYYTCRHAWATNYILSGGNPIYLAEMMGRSMSGIFRYVNSLTSVEKVIKERERVFGKSE